VLIWGKKLFGRLDRLPGAFYIATLFHHFWFMPLLPIESFVVFEGTEYRGQFQGVPIPLDWRSVLMAYGRGVLVVSGVVVAFRGTILLLSHYFDQTGAAPLGAAIPWTLVSILCFVVYGLSRRVLRTASEERARDIARMAGLDESKMEEALQAVRMVTPHGRSTV